ncbi:MAG: PilZ domain-containing protein [Methylobacter sp.]|nr:PilZ domain-containing protein [Methylobacter sp.]
MKNPYKTPQQQRKNERVSIALPVKVFDQTGISRNASAGGILFELNHFNEVGSKISFELELNTPNGKMKLKCTGDIVRTEAKGPKTAIAVKITDSQFE